MFVLSSAANILCWPAGLHFVSMLECCYGYTLPIITNAGVTPVPWNNHLIIHAIETSQCVQSHSILQLIRQHKLCHLTLNVTICHSPRHKPFVFWKRIGWNLRCHSLCITNSLDSGDSMMFKWWIGRLQCKLDSALILGMFW